MSIYFIFLTFINITYFTIFFDVFKAKVVLCLMVHKKGGGEFNLERFSFVMPDVPSQTNE